MILILIYETPKHKNHKCGAMVSFYLFKFFSKRSTSLKCEPILIDFPRGNSDNQSIL